MDHVSSAEINFAVLALLEGGTQSEVARARAYCESLTDAQVLELASRLRKQHGAATLALTIGVFAILPLMLVAYVNKDKFWRAVALMTFTAFLIAVLFIATTRREKLNREPRLLHKALLHNSTECAFKTIVALMRQVEHNLFRGDLEAAALGHLGEIINSEPSTLGCLSTPERRFLWRRARVLGIKRCLKPEEQQFVDAITAHINSNDM